jgi:arabinan endo-1,5-alpha-L-arabinosidase
MYILIIPYVLIFITKSFAYNVTADSFTLIYDPSVGEHEKWYINDHTFIKDLNGTWHLFGITHKEPADPEHEINFAHATAPHLFGPWIKQPFALNFDPNYFGEVHLWAPHVIRVNETYYMFYCGGDADHTQYAISLATSEDLFNWKRLPSGPLFRDGFDARDPMVTKINDLWHLFYDATEPPKFGNHIIAYRTSTDLIHWSERHIAFTDPSKGDFGGPTESPFVIHHNEWWYLFTGPRPEYRGTDVFRSQNPVDFQLSQQVGHINSHAAEIINDDGDWWISHCGWGEGGVWLAPLQW